MAKVKKVFDEFMEGSKLFGELISSIINLVLLSFVYFVGIGLTSIFARFLGKKFLDKKIDKKSRTYWQELNLNINPIGYYYRQF